MIDKNVPRKFVGWVNAFWIILIWLTLMYGLFLGSIYIFKSVLGIYSLQERTDRLEYRLDHMEAK